MEPGSGLAVPEPENHGILTTFALKQSADAGGKKISCSSSVAARTTQSFSMKVKKGALVKGKWRVTKWVGTLKVSAKKKAYGSYTAALTGTLKK